MATAGNCYTFAQYVVQFAYPALSMDQIDARWVNVMAIAVQGIVCLALYFARPACFFLNNIFAVFKVVCPFNRRIHRYSTCGFWI